MSERAWHPAVMWAYESDHWTLTISRRWHMPGLIGLHVRKCRGGQCVVWGYVFGPFMLSRSRVVADAS